MGSGAEEYASPETVNPTLKSPVLMVSLAIDAWDPQSAGQDDAASPPLRALP